MRATCPGARSGRISITTLPLVVSSVSVSSGLAIITLHTIRSSPHTIRSSPNTIRSSPRKRGSSNQPRALTLDSRLRGNDRSKDSVPLTLDRCLFYVIGPREFLGQIGIAFVLDAALVRTAAAWGALAIFRIDRVHYIHTRHHAAKWCETRLIELGIVAEVDEHLAGACVRTRRREGDGAALVALGDLVIRDLRSAPARHDCGIPIDAELHHEAGDHAEKTGAVVKAVLDEIVEPVGAFRRPGARHLDHEHAPGRIEPRFISCGRLLAQRGGILERRLRQGRRSKSGQRKCQREDPSAGYDFSPPLDARPVSVRISSSAAPLPALGRIPRPP